MNTIQKAAAAAMALTITLTGAVLTTAPMTLAGSSPLAAYSGSRSPGRSQPMVPGQGGFKEVARTATDLAQS